MSEKLARITAALDALDKEHKAARAKIFKDEGVTAERYYNSYWKDWLKKERERTNKIAENL